MKRLKRKFILFFLLSVYSCTLCAQKKSYGYSEDPYIDSLSFVLNNNAADSTKTDIYIQLGYYCSANASYPYSRNRDNEKAISYSDSVLLLSKKLNDKKREASGWDILGYSNFNGGNLINSLKYWLIALKIVESIKDSVGMAWTNNNLARVHKAMGNYPESLKYAQLALMISKQQKLKEYVTVPYNTIGEIYQLTGEYDEALKTYNTIIEYIDSVNEPDNSVCGYVGCYTGIGNAFMQKGNYSEALKKLFTALKMMDRCWNRSRYVALYVGIGNIYQKIAFASQKPLDKKYFDSSAYYYIKALESSDSMKLYVQAPEIYSGLSLTYYELKDYKNAYHYSDLLSKFKDSNLNATAYKKVSELTNEYEDDKTKAINSLILEKQFAEQKNRRTLFATILIAALIILIFILISLRKRTLKKKAFEKAETAHKMTELELQSLRAQLNPHFMFNSLNAIQDLILKEDIDKSHIYLSRFSELLRMLLDNASQPFVSLNKELLLLDNYLSLEKLRLPNLEYSFAIDTNVNSETIMIPNMMLQPYIENAIWHGLSHKKGSRKLEIRIKRNEHSVLFEIEDNGVGRKKASEIKSVAGKVHKSKGMELLSKRFSLLSKEYNAEIQTRVTDLEINGNEIAGTLVEISVPFSLTEKAIQFFYDTNHYN